MQRIQDAKAATAEQAKRELDAKELEARRAQWLKLQEEFGDVEEPSRKWRQRPPGVEEEPVGRDPAYMVTEPDDEATQPPTASVAPGPGHGWGWY